MCSSYTFLFTEHLSNMSALQEPAVITLDSVNSVKIIVQYIELAQTKGAYDLNEAELLKRASDVVINGVVDNELNITNSKQLLVQGIHKGQRHGAYTLNDAALLSKVVKFVLGTLNELAQTQAQAQAQSPAPAQAPAQAQAPVPEPAPAQSTLEVDDNEITDDLSSLADPIPLKPKVI